MSESILESTKKLLGIAPDYDAFDMDVMIHINSALSILRQLGVGPEDGFVITGPSTTWAEFADDNALLGAVKAYIYFKVRLAFDPPTSSFALTSFQKQITELEWRLNVHREGVDWEYE